MQLALADLMCPTCRGYVHPLFDRCPGCGTRRRSHYVDLLRDADLGTGTAAGDPAVVAAATETIRRTTTLDALHGAFFRGRSQPGPDISGNVDAAGMIDFVGGRMTYRARGVPDQREAPIDARIRVVGDALVVSTPRDGRTLISVPAAAVLAASPGAGGIRGARPWDGTWMEGARASLTSVLPPGDFLVVYATERGVASFSLANPSGFFANRPGRAHYEELARWIGLLAVAAAEKRWRGIGVDAYLAELGLVTAAGFPVQLPKTETAAPVDRPAVPAAQGARSAREALLELEDLRTARLISAAEYEEKRQAILRRL